MSALLPQVAVGFNSLTEKAVSAEEQAQFLSQLAEDLNSKNVELPSFPDVVINIRTALEDPSCTAERLGDVVRTDAVLVAKLLMKANSAYHNRAGIEIVDLDLAISRLGFEEVRNAAITLAVEQLFQAEEHDDIRDVLKIVWDKSMSLASMSFVLAKQSGGVNADNAFLGGLLHEIGSLYILTRVQKYPGLMGDPEKLGELLEQWTPTIGRSIVDSWGFPSAIADSLEIDEHHHPEDAGPANVVDVVYAAKCLLQEEQTEPDESTSAKLNIGSDSLPGIREAYEVHCQSLRQSAGG